MARNLRMFMGQDSGGDFAWRVTKSGYDALTETDQENFTFNSDWPRTGLIHETGETDGSAYVFFDELPFVPQVLLFRRDGATFYNGEQIIVIWPIGGAPSGPVSAYFPADVRVDRFVANIVTGCPTPHVFPYIVFKVPVIGA